MRYVYKHVIFYKTILALSVVAALLITAGSVQAQEDLPQNLIREVGFDQKLDEQVPLHLTFTDSTGQRVRLGDYFADKPVVLAMGYYECPMLCSIVRNELFQSLKELDFTIGQEFEIVIVGIDPDETPEIAEAKRRASMMEYERSTSGEGWNFLVGEEENIKQLADSIGFRYTYDAKIDQYLHPSGILVLTPEGKISRYLYGIDYPAQDLRLGLVEAAENKIGSAVDQLLLLCYHYDPVSGEYTLFIMNILRIVGLITVVFIGSALWLLMRNGKPSVIGNQ